MVIQRSPHFRENRLLSSFPTTTRRLKIVGVTPDLAASERGVRADFANAVQADVPASWPPEFPSPSDEHENLAWNNYYLILSGETGDTLVGFVGLAPYPTETRAIEFGVAIVPEHRRKGIAQEFISAIAQWACSEQELDYVVTDAHVGHEGALGILEPLGFTKALDVPEPGFERFTLFVG